MSDMGNKTTIPYCDSTLNLQMGCNGCELWNKDAKECYAGVITTNWAGQKGYPAKFDEPEIFPERMDDLKSWSDLTGKARDDKPWIPPEMPRIIFLNDMGDTFTEDLPVDWMLPYMRVMEKMPHLFLLLTKRPRRMLELFDAYGSVPNNMWPGVSVTTQASTPRIDYLAELHVTTWLSVEPMLQEIDLSKWLFEPPFDWVVVGGLSYTPRTRPLEKFQRMQLRWVRRLYDQCQLADIKWFSKQLGGTNVDRKERLSDWPEDLRVREFPEYTPLQPGLW